MNMQLKPVVLAAGVFAVLSITPALADYYQAPYGPGGTWRIYETPRPGMTFKAAQIDARASKDPVYHLVQGELVSVTSLGKNTFIYRSVGKAPGDSWIGLTDREAAAPGAFESQGEPDNRAAGWAWTNGDPYSYQNFGAGEPNDAGGEDASHLRSDGLWNDNKSGYFANDPDDAVIKPGTSTDETAAPALGFVVEYAVNSPTPLPGIRYGMVFPPCATFPVPPNTAGNWSVREVRNLSLAGNVFDSVDKALAGGGTTFDAQRPYLDAADPETNINGGPVIATPPNPFISNDLNGPVTDDDAILTMARTRIRIAPGKAGIYTVRVHGDDGFAMRIKGVPWIAVAGGTDVNRGYIDPLDPTALIYERGTGDANTQATINLAAGDYDVEFIHWEGAGGAFYEVTATSADALNGNTVVWQPFGSTTDVPAVNTVNTVYLQANAQVHNANLRDRGNALPAMRWLIDNTAGTEGVKTLLQLGEGDMPNNNGGDNYVTKVTGKIVVAADANGNATPGETIPITFRLNCDDGASMRIIGQDFVSANVGGGRALIDNGGDTTLTADFPTGDTDARGLVNLVEGNTYDFVCYMYEYGGGSNFNLFWQLGDFVAANLSAPTGLSTAAGAVALQAPGATVKNVPINFGFTPFLSAARSILAEAIPQGVTDSGNTSIVVLRDGDDICCGRPGNTIYAQAAVMPNGGPDNYVTRVAGKLVVDNQNGTPGESLTLSFGIYADDGMELRIVGKNFDAVNDYTGDGTATLDTVNGDTVIRADYFTGNCNAMGRITLPEGVYDFEATTFEGGGDSGLEVWWAVGDYLATGFDGTAFRPLKTGAGNFIPPSYGIPLIAAVNNDADNDGMPAAYETANGFSDSDASDATADKDGDGATNRDEYLAGTNPGSAASRFALESITFSGSNVIVKAPVVANHYYRLFSSTDLQTWTEAGRALPTANGTQTWNIPVSFFPSGSRVFFKADVCPNN